MAIGGGSSVVAMGWERASIDISNNRKFPGVMRGTSHVVAQAGQSSDDFDLRAADILDCSPCPEPPCPEPPVP